MWSELVMNLLKNSSGSKQEGPNNSQASQLGSNVQNQMILKKSMDTGFYGHMTVDKAKKGNKVNIIGRGD